MIFTTKNMHSLLRYFIFSATLVVLMASCDERIPWDVDPEQRRIIVEGRITDELKQHEVTLRVSNDIFDPDRPAVVEGAELTVFDGTYTYTFEDLGSGRYQSREIFAGEIGRTYELTINLEQPIGELTNYTASSTMRPNLTLDSLSAAREELDDFFDEYDGDSTYFFRFFGQEPEGKGHHYLCELWRNGENYTDPINQVVIFEDDFIDGIEFEDFDIFIAADFDQDDFEVGDEVVLRIYSIEKEYYDFLTAFFNQEDSGDPFGFSSPPANVDGNISGTGLGYFYAASMATARTVLED